MVAIATLPGERTLILKYAVGTLQHLGSQLYSGGLVPTIAELIANAWDADAKRVKITVPFNKPWGPTSVIGVEDDGLGMTFEDCRDKFLIIGRDRRKDGEKTAKGRYVMGHKGVGKLACFGVAPLVEIRTVRDKWLTHFKIDYNELLTKSKDPAEPLDYKPDILADRNTSETSSTKVTLRNCTLSRAVDEKDFRESMTRRFSVLSTQFAVEINGKALKPFDLPLFMRTPQKGFEEEDIPEFGRVQWWVGFTQDTVKAKDAQGVAVVARGRMAQKLFFFDLRGGFTGQFGMQYMIGEVIADGIDADADLIATGRESVNFHDQRAKPLLEWGQKLVKEQLSLWIKEREKRKQDSLKAKPHIWNRIEHFTGAERTEIQKAITKLASLEGVDDDRLAELVELFIRAYEDQHFMDLIRQLNALDVEKHEELFQLLVEWDVLEAVHTAQIVYGRIQVIEQFEHLLQIGAKEKPDMQDFVKQHPWLLNPTWTILEHEKQLDNVLIRQFGLSKDQGGRSKERVDYFCLAGAGLYVVVDLKRPGMTVGKNELRQLQNYVHYLRDHIGDTPLQNTPSIYGLLVASKLHEDARQLRAEMEPFNQRFSRWDDLLRTAKTLHKDFLEVVRKRAPEDHPTMNALTKAAVEDGTISKAAIRSLKTVKKAKSARKRVAVRKPLKASKPKPAKAQAPNTKKKVKQ